MRALAVTETTVLIARRGKRGLLKVAIDAPPTATLENVAADQPTTVRAVVADSDVYYTALDDNLIVRVRGNGVAESSPARPAQGYRRAGRPHLHRHVRRSRALAPERAISRGALHRGELGVDGGLVDCVPLRLRKACRSRRLRTTGKQRGEHRSESRRRRVQGRGTQGAGVCIAEEAKALTALHDGVFAVPERDRQEGAHVDASPPRTSSRCHRSAGSACGSCRLFAGFLARAEEDGDAHGTHTERRATTHEAGQAGQVRFTLDPRRAVD